MSTAATVSFRWLDLLEKEFDNSYMDLEKVARTFSDEYDFVETSEVLRKLLSNLGQCFVQLVHKSQTIFQTNAKLEAELVHLREELSVAHATLSKTESEKKYLICCLQSTLIDNHKLRAASSKDGVTLSGIDASHDNDLLCESIQMRLAKEMSGIQKVDWDKKRLEEKCLVLENENRELRKNRIEIESELVGARLDAKYLDKELAGRIQQIQILLASNTSHEHKQKVWSQIEASMHLQRSKTIANMCFSKQRVKDSARNNNSTTTTTTTSSSTSVQTSSSSPVSVASTSTPDTSDKNAVSIDGTVSSLTNGASATKTSTANGGGRAGSGRYKQVHFHKHDTEDLGMAILGGKEYGLPIMISEIFPDSAVSRCAKIGAGDILLAVNGDSFLEMSHTEAVKYLSSLRGSIRFDLENTIEADIDEVCDTSTHYYEFYETDMDERHCKKNTQPERMFLQHPGKARPAEPKKPPPSSGSLSAPKELPKVHTSSPRKTSETTQK